MIFDCSLLQRIYFSSLTLRNIPANAAYSLMEAFCLLLYTIYFWKVKLLINHAAFLSYIHCCNIQQFSEVPLPPLYKIPRLPCFWTTPVVPYWIFSSIPFYVSISTFNFALHADQGLGGTVWYFLGLILAKLATLSTNECVRIFPLLLEVLWSLASEILCRGNYFGTPWCTSGHRFSQAYEMKKRVWGKQFWRISCPVSMISCILAFS